MNGDQQMPGQRPEIVAGFDTGLNEFARMRETYLLYH
jgi:hypothetical protein